MPPILTASGHWLLRRAENLAALMLAVMFVAFLIQILFRYVLNWPAGWASEVSTMMWIWLVLWGAAFVVRERDEIRFDVLYAGAKGRLRRAMTLVTAAAIVGLYLVSLPEVVDYVTFMKVQRTAYLRIRFDHLYSVYILFAVAIVVRYLWIGWAAILGRDGADGASDGADDEAGA